MKVHVAIAALFAAAPVVLAAPTVPLPDAPVRLLIDDPAAFDAALSGAFRAALYGTPDTDDPVVRSWRETQVGAKLEDQWGRFVSDADLSWGDVMKMQPTAVGFALLQVGNLEGVLVVATPLAGLPLPLPEGTKKVYGGAEYHLVAAGAADGQETGDRRMGLAYALADGRFYLATSERALRLALDAARSGKGMADPLPGLVSLELDMDALAADRYFRREFLYWDKARTPRGRIRSALRVEDGRMVEVRQGAGDAGLPGRSFEVADAVASGWEPDGSRFFPALRAGLLEPEPDLSDRPVAAVAPLPPVLQTAVDPYTVNFEKHARASGGGVAYEEGDLADWRALLEEHPVPGFGYAVTADDRRILCVAWPTSADRDLERLCRATIERRAGRASVEPRGKAREIDVGPDLPTLAFRRAGDFLWIASDARSLATLPAVRATVLTRWARLDLDAARRLGPAWKKVESGVYGQPGHFTDRMAGVLGWIPRMRALSVERRRTATGWTERVVLAP